MDLYHYYEKGTPPFRVLSDLSFQDATETLERLRIEHPHAQLASRPPDYMRRRLNCERMLREAFLKKGGMIQREDPYYMTLGHSPWLSTWFDECACIRIPAEEFDLRTVSFTYGDSHPTFSPAAQDGKEYRGQLYTFAEILKLIEKYGYPQDWNDDGRFGPERYIEAQIWSDETVGRYRS